MVLTCTGFIEPLNLECILVNMFAGNALIFAFIAFIAIASLCAMFRMRNDVTLIVLSLFGIIFSSLIPFVYLLIVLLIAILFGVALRKLMQ